MKLTIAAPFVSISLTYIDDTNGFLLCGVRQQAVAVAEVWHLKPDHSVTFIGRSEPHGKDNSVDAGIFNTGLVTMVVSEADPAASGTTSAPHVYTFQTGIRPIRASNSSGTVDTLARNKIAALKQQLAEAASVL